MKTLQFKTNIKCGGCIAAVEPVLTHAEGIDHWDVDLKSPDRIMTVVTDQHATEIAELVRQVGYEAELIA